jgi:hypothetical protein
MIDRHTKTEPIDKTQNINFNKILKLRDNAINNNIINDEISD